MNSNTLKIKKVDDIQSIAVVGLGYVGLPLAILADKKGLRVIGLDSDKSKIESLNSGKSYIDDIEDSQVAASNISFTCDPKKVGDIDAVIVCVPTPVTKLKVPDLTPVKGALNSIAPYLKKRCLVVIESTVNPGVCDELVKPILEDRTGMTVGKDIFLVHCPERINPGDPKWNVSNISRVVGANSPEELALGVSLYEKLIDAQIKPMGTIKEAEAVKIVENSFRDVNIAFVNELAKSFNKLGINLENVLEGAATKPFSFLLHHPGCGVGGHCIPVDPYYLIEYAEHHQFDHKFLKLARNINESMPRYTVDLLIDALAGIDKSLKRQKVALLGLSYKANVKDARESPAFVIKELLESEGAVLSIYDPYFPQESTATSLQSAINNASAIVIATDHNEFRQLPSIDLSGAGVHVIIDGKNMLRNELSQMPSELIYKGIGV